ncbi:phage tail protein [Erythrobacter litoralis]|uniref:Uncharacterized protein n=1 Tax=Erythrobacter litoralis (strain HTCC2594) TaxID=314225 RepID=Q2N607_ERYLH|nr:phage tail protein [Erythrobacter litoralis]ABC64884.1 hypothetical protein ELI_13960 [Erythrobacter litoralis HTCC2594]
MATLLLSAVGTLVGGPLGGAIGALAGRQIDAQVIGSPTREGPRLKELAVSTSSYGTPIPRIHGTMRVPGTIIWATDLVETRETEGGGKGKPKTTTYSYSASFAIAVSSRAIDGIGRIWADGNLLRGRAGDLKTGGTLRVHTGRGDQPLDPLIASDRMACPAFRHCAYVVFEDLDLTDFGNRIPALSFEVFAGASEVGLADLAAGTEMEEAGPRLPGLRGFAVDGGPLARSLEAIGAVFPLSCDAQGQGLRFSDPDIVEADRTLPETARAWEESDFGQLHGRQSDRSTGEPSLPHAVRYYDPARDYQPGIQRAVGPTPAAGQRVVELPATLDAADAKSLSEKATQRARWRRDRLAWRLAELDPAIGPGSVVRVPGHAGDWLVGGWEWRERGVELELLRRRPGSARNGGDDAGDLRALPDRLPGPTVLDYFELPGDGVSQPNAARAFASVTATGRSSSVALFAQSQGQLTRVASAQRADSVQGQLAAPLTGSPALRIERSASLAVSVSTPDGAFDSASAEAIVRGANRILVGGEIIQFATASQAGEDSWMLSGLLRGRGGTEAAAARGHAAGTPVILLDDRLVDMQASGAPIPVDGDLAAIGPGDAEPVHAPLRNVGLTLRPLVPVHPRCTISGSDGLAACWMRRARGAWTWPEAVEVPLVEERESYRVGAGPVDTPVRSWSVDTNRFELAPASLSELLAIAAGEPLWVRQVGTHDLSPPLLLATLP